MISNIATWFFRRIQTLSQRLWLWSVVSRFKDPHDRLRARHVLTNNLNALPDDAAHSIIYLLTEDELTTRRLARRYDPSMALNEAFDRAAQAVKTGKQPQAPIKPSGDPVIDQYYENMYANPPALTPPQQAALAVQQRTLRRNLDHQ